jgi:hypothetical protein
LLDSELPVDGLMDQFPAGSALVLTVVVADRVLERELRVERPVAETRVRVEPR